MAKGTVIDRDGKWCSSMRGRDGDIDGHIVEGFVLLWLFQQQSNVGWSHISCVLWGQTGRFNVDVLAVLYVAGPGCQAGEEVVDGVPYCIGEGRLRSHAA